jgi:hypothetical protein
MACLSGILGATPGVPPARAQNASSGEVKLTTEGIAFRNPSGYRPMDPHTPGLPATMAKASYIIMGPVTDKFTANINIISREVPADKLPDNFLQILESKYKQIASQGKMAELKLIGKTRIKVAGQDAWAMTVSIRRAKTDPAIQNRQVFLVHKGRYYEITFTSLAKVFKQQSAALDRLLNSLRWLSPAEMRGLSTPTKSPKQ